MNKPEAVARIEKFILENEPKIEKLEDRLRHLTGQRPEIHFSGEAKALEVLDGKIKEVEKELADLELDIKGARQMLTKELKKWVQAEQETLEAKADSLDKEADAAAKKTDELIKKIEDINGSILVRFHNDGSKEQRLRRSAEFSRRRIENVSETAKNMLSV